MFLCLHRSQNKNAARMAASQKQINPQEKNVILEPGVSCRAKDLGVPRDAPLFWAHNARLARFLIVLWGSEPEIQPLYLD